MPSGRQWQAMRKKKQRRLAETTKAYSEIESCLTPLLEGTVVAIDPSIGSQSSMPGWAAYTAGILVDSGTLEIPLGWGVPERLQEVARQLRELYRIYKPVDVLVYEQIASQFFGGKGKKFGNAASMASLQKALGAILSVPGPTSFVGLSPQTWKRLVSDTYVKSDEADAVEMGKIAISLAQEIQENGKPEETDEKIESSTKKEKKAKTREEEAPWE